MRSRIPVATEVAFVLSASDAFTRAESSLRINWSTVGDHFWASGGTGPPVRTRLTSRFSSAVKRSNSGEVSSCSYGARMSPVRTVRFFR
ncbi:hypothetical protein Mame01_38910 [Microbispora amethystogenes]|nr:hypothetical protein Mame01_38910 [Microbispora amethystogenes]